MRVYGCFRFTVHSAVVTADKAGTKVKDSERSDYINSLICLFYCYFYHSLHSFCGICPWAVFAIFYAIFGFHFDSIRLNKMHFIVLDRKSNKQFYSKQVHWITSKVNSGHQYHHTQNIHSKRLRIEFFIIVKVF